MKGKRLFQAFGVIGFVCATFAWASDETDAKLHDQLRQALDARARGVLATESHLPDALLRGDQVLVEVRFRGDENGDDALSLLSRHGGTPANRLADSLHEVWMPVSRLSELASESDVVQIAPARLAHLLIGSKTSEGVHAGNADLWQGFNPAYTGTGIKIALIDAFNAAKISSLQSSNDWPPNTRLTKNDFKTYPVPNTSVCSVHGFGCEGTPHGNATMEILYDLAPAATFIAYDISTVGDWRTAILNAANVGTTGTPLGSIRANVISESLSAPLDGIGDGTDRVGSIAEAAKFAKARGIAVVNAAGNERRNHWGGAFTQSNVSSYHSWSGTTNPVNKLVLDTTGQPQCYAAGVEIDVSMYWNDWSSPTHNYDLYLYQLPTVPPNPAVAQSVNLQNGGSMQLPQELIQFKTTSGTTPGCPTNTAQYGIAVVRVTGDSTDNLQVFASTTAGGHLTYSVAASSLDFPADSPDVVSVAAIDVNTSAQEVFSSQGPVLKTGGDPPTANPSTDPNLKPDLSSFDNVTTVTSAPSTFTGTSASAPHVAGMVALFMQKFGIPADSTALTNNIITPLRTIASTGANDLGAAGKDYLYGYGRLKFAQDTGFKFLQQPSNTVAGATMTPAVKVGVIDSAGLADPYTLYTDAMLAIGTNPSGGTLTGGGSQALTAGVATFSGLSINKSGTGYTLSATSTPTGLTATSNAFNITVGAATHIAYLVQPSNVVAGNAITPTVQVAVEDANNNVVTTATNAITLRKTTCNTVIPDGGGPIAAVNGVASFPSLTLNTAASGVILQASATGFTAVNSTAFNVTANDTIFASGFELSSCVP